jgi:putative drug exporter of the RND superfamily
VFTALGRLIVRRSKLVLFGSLAAVLVTAALGLGVFDALSGGGFDDPDSESAQADAILEDEFDAGPPNIVLIVTAEGGDIDAPDAVAAGNALTEELGATDGLADVVSYWQLGSPEALRSEDGSSALAFARIPGGSEAEEEAVHALQERFADGAGFEGLDVEVSGGAAVGTAIGETVEEDLALAEAIAIPLTLLLLVVVFRGVVAALLPLVVGTAAIFGAFFVLLAIAQITDVSIFSINLVTALGLGLAIDYALLLVSRFREELDAGRSVDDATIRTVESAGRTVAFSGLTVAVSLASLVVFPQYFLRSFAYAGVGVLLVAMAASVVTLPAMLHLLGHKVNSWSLPGRDRSRRSRRGGTGTGSDAAHAGESAFWARTTERALKRPALVAVVAVAGLLFVGLPFLNLRLGSPDARVLPSDNEARLSIERLEAEFSSDEADAFPVVLPGSHAADGVADDIDAYAADISVVDHIAQVDTARGRWVDGQLVEEATPASARFATDGGEWFEVIPAVRPMSGEAESAIGDIRDLDPPFEAAVGGATAQLVDTKSAISSLAPWAGAWIAIATFVLLFLMFGSFLVPLKAIVLNTLSLTATFGAMVWVFQEGHLSGVLDFTPTGMTDASMPILMFAIAFGLSMDYEVFLLSRVKEEHDRTGDNHQSIVRGLAKTGRIVTAAALVLSITFFAFATGGITFMKLFGLGLAIAVLVDAFVVRATLVPALMQMAGEANWWAPAWARRIHARFGLSESADHDEPDPSPTTAAPDRDREPAEPPPLP